MAIFGLNSWFFQDLSLEEIFKRFNAIGYGGVELPDIRGLKGEEWREARSLLSNYNLKPLSIAAVLGLRPDERSISFLDRARREEAIAFIKECIDLAGEVGAEMVIIGTGAYDPRGDRDAQWRNTVDALKEICDYGEGKGVLVSLENFPWRIAGPTRDMVKMIEEVGSRNLKCTLDTGHLNILGERLDEAVKEAKEYLIHIHINNNDGTKDNHRDPEDGSLAQDDYKALFKTAKDIHYKGAYSFELLPQPEPDKIAEKSLKYIKSILEGI